MQQHTTEASWSTKTARTSQGKARSPYAIALDRGDAELHTAPHLLKAKELYKHLVWLAGSERGKRDSIAITQPELAETMQVSRRTIIKHLQILEAHNLVWWTRGVGNICTYVITSYRPRPEVEPEVQIVGDNPSLNSVAEAAGPFFGPASCDVECTPDVKPTSHLSFKEINQGLNQMPPLPPTGGTGGGIGHSGSFFGREEIPDTPSTEILKAEGVKSATALREFSGRSVAEIRAAVAAVDARANPPHDRAAFLVHLLRMGIWQAAPPPVPAPDDRPKKVRYVMRRLPDGSVQSEVIRADSA